MTGQRERFHRVTWRLYHKNMGAADVETEGFLGATILGGLRHWDGSYRTFTSMDAMLEAMIDTPLADAGPRNRHPDRHTSGTIWLHNLANFDGGRLADAVLRMVEAHPEIDVSVIPQGDSKFIALVLKIPQPREENRWYQVSIADSFAVMPSSLEKMAVAFAPDMPKLAKCPDHDFENGGPWFSPACQGCLDYLKRDVDALLTSMENLEGLAHKVFSAPISVTAGSLAWKGSLTMVPEGGCWFRLSAASEAWLRPAVHGGFVWPGHRRGDRGPAVAFDHSGAYAEQLRQGLPYGHPRYTTIWRTDVPGVWDATVRVPEDIEIPILTGPPGGPAYPTGTFRSKFTSIELEYAEKLGCSFEIHEGIIFDGYTYPFNPFIDKCEELEYPADGSECDPALKALVKLMRNALPGKFATKPVIMQWRLGTDAREGEEFLVDSDTGKVLPMLGKMAEIDGAAYIHPEWNAFITARQRIKIHGELLAAGDRAYYSDTDSKYIEPATAAELVDKGILQCGNGYGLNHPEGNFERLIVAGPKNKVGIKADGKRSITAKGIPKKIREANAELQELAARGEAAVITYESVNSFKQRLSHPEKPFGLVRTRSYSVLEKSASWKVDGNDNIRPRAAV